MEYKTLEILKEETYRNQPYVNISDNMVRVTLKCSRNEWNDIKRHLSRLGLMEGYANGKQLVLKTSVGQ
jgi:hypothetical protein